MAETKFTPGPWRMVGTTANRFVVTASSGTVIAETWKDFRQEADARLIAAAPELYGALEALIAMQDQMSRKPTDGGGVFPADYGIVRGRAHAALAKARGES